MGGTLRRRPARRTASRGVAIGSVLLSVGLLAAACGDDSDSGATATTAAASATTAAGAATTAATAGAGSTTTVSIDPTTLTNGQGVTDDTITIGVTMDQSGPFAILAGPIKAAFDAKIAFLNDQGGVLGRQIKIIYYDDKSDPAQVLQNFKRLWEQDKVFGIYVANIVGPPLDYVAQKNVATTLLGGPPAVFSSKYPTIFPTGSITPAWNAQADFAVVNVLGMKPKVVAVSYLPYEEPVLDFIENAWKTLGAETVIMDPWPGGPADPCDAFVLKYKDANVDYWDMHATNFLSCIPAEVKAGWSPPMGQGGPSTSSLDLSSFIGKPMADLGVIAGAPTTQADGSPVHTSPTPATKEYVDSMTKYQAEFTNSHDINDWAPQLAYMGGTWFADGIVGSAQLTGGISPEGLIQWAQTVKNWDPGLAEPVKSMAPDCKTGNDSTVWGKWTWDEANQRLKMVPFAPSPGEPMVNSDFLGVDECYLTQMADEFFS